MLCGKRRGNLETVTLLHTVWVLSELRTDKLAQVAPATFHRSDEVVVMAMVLCVCYQHTSTPDHRCRLREG